MAVMNAAADTSSAESRRILRIREQMKQALAEADVALPGLDAAFADTESRNDPFDGSATLFCHWRDIHHNLRGSVQLHDSGRVYAEYDVLRTHPQRPAWFIEAVTVWGDDSGLRSELRLLPLPG
ncbi:MAG: hypothetical protein KYX62_00975 [Pseudomonadota bacterium]|nr:hypothetical protein [Pseudomonadota bacterium]